MTTTVKTDTLTWTAEDGVTLVAEAWGDPEAPPVLLSHGGGQTRHAWRRTGETLAAEGWYAVAYDHRGHGDSGWAPDGRYNLHQFARDQRWIAESLHAPPAVVGASLGGLSALLAQGENSETEVYSAVVLVDITPQMDQQGALKVMAFMEDSLTEGFADLEEAAEAIARYTGRKKRVNPAGLKKNLRWCDDGRYRWHWDPKFLGLREDHNSSPEALMEATQRIRQPMLLVRGMLSDIVTEAVAEDFLQRVPHARYVDVADARHMVAGDKNDVFTESVVAFLKDL